MRAGKIPGAVFVVVRAGQVVCEKAYGVADLATGRPVSTGHTLFRVASISKILTAASVLQLVHTHQLDLHRNVNDYLTRFQIAPAFGEPVTLGNLLTHSGGFDENPLGYAARSPADQLSLRAYLERYQPARVRPPGQFSVYDNYGFALAGYLVQQAAGVPFDDYVREKLLDPLGMAQTSFSPDAAQQQQMATGYWLDDGSPRACAQNYVNITPAAGLCTTAADMSEFLIALLADRRPDGSNMFPASILSGLEAQQFASDADVPGRCYGFNEISLAGRPALRQPGQWPGFNSVLLLFPRQHCGLFLAYNLCDYEVMERQIARAFAEQFIAPAPPARVAQDSFVPATEDAIEPLLGAYLSARTAHDAPQLNFPGEIEVTRSPDGNLAIDGQPYREIEPSVFAKIETNVAGATWSGRRVAFRRGADGGAWRLITQSGVYRRAAWIESRHGRQFLLRAVTVVFLSVIVLWPIMGLMRLSFANRSPGPLPAGRRRVNFSTAARSTALVACALALWFEAALALAELRLRPFADFYGFPAPVRNLLWALPVLLGLTTALVLFAVIAWRKKFWHPAHRVHYTLLATACAVFLYIFYARHLLFVG